jgi:hypothetical protein
MSIGILQLSYFLQLICIKSSNFHLEFDLFYFMNTMLVPNRLQTTIHILRMRLPNTTPMAKRDDAYTSMSSFLCDVE